MPDLLDASRDRPTRGLGTVALTLGGLVAAFAVASCCGLPFMLATLGLGTTWLGGFALLAAPHRLLLLTAATFFLAVAAVLLWRQRTAVCVPGAVCTYPTIRGITIVGLLAGMALLYLGYTYA